MSHVKNTDFEIEPEYTNPAMKYYEVDGQIDIFAFIDKNEQQIQNVAQKNNTPFGVLFNLPRHRG